MEKLVIKKRRADEIACWKVPATGVCPNTVIESDRGITLLVKVDGVSFPPESSDSFIMNGLVNPGQKAKLFGGKKPYQSCEIYAVDFSSEFKSEWGLAGPAALPCYDAELEVDAKAVCFGEYFYKIDDFNAFVRCLPLGEKEEISRDDVREYLRAQTAGVVKTYLASKLAGRDIKDCQAKLGEYAEDVKDQLNKHFDSKGITIQSFLVSNLDYEPAHKANRELLKGAKVGVKIKGVINEGRRDDISVDKAESEIEIGLINARMGNSGNNNNNSNNNASAGAKVRCPRCGELNENSNYCHKCGESLRGKKN